MHDTLGVAVGNPRGDPSHYEPSLRLRQAPAGVDVVQEVAVVRQLQHEEDLSRRLHQPVEGENVRMVETLQGEYLAREELLQKFFRRTFLLDDLDGDLA